MSHEDYKKLMSAVLRQTMEDYVRLQHPRFRRRKYEREAFWSARDLLWDESCLLGINNEEGEPHTLRTLAMAASGRENVDLEKLRTYLVEESRRYWENKTVKTIEIPTDVVIEGYAYTVQQADAPTVDYNTKTIYLDRRSPTAEEQFMELLLELSCYHGEIRTSGKAKKDLAKVLYRLLRINSCFTGE